MQGIRKKLDQKSNPLVSIVTPSLNQGRYIEETIASVVNQTYKNFEHIIMDGGSTDDTIDIVKKYAADGRIKWHSGKDTGQYDAVNKGFTNAKGSILGWINADDIYHECAVEKIVEVFNEQPNVDVVYGKFYTFQDGRKYMKSMFTRPFSHKWLRRYCYTNPSVTFVRASTVRDEGFLINTSIPTYGDWDWYLRMAESGKKFHYIPEILGYFRIHSSSRIMRMNQQQIRIERSMIAQRHNIPMQYISLWFDYIIPWTERFESLYHLLKKGDWREIAARFASATTFIYKDFRRRLI